MAALLVALLLLRHALDASRAEGLRELVGAPDADPRAARLLPFWGFVRRLNRPALISPSVGVTVGWFGWRLAGAGGSLAGLIAGSATPLLVATRARRQRTELLERQVAEVAESVAMAVRSGLSVHQALQFTASEADEPIRASVEEMVRSNELGTPLERAISRWAVAIGTDEARLLALVLTIHGRSGGDLGSALEVVAETIRHRISVRRELRAMSAQGRMSGAILGSLPIAFLVVLAATSRSELVPVYRSGAGTAMVLSGILLEVLAYVWIRRILRVEV
jgi:tight adherence protein B